MSGPRLLALPAADDPRAARLAALVAGLLALGLYAATLLRGLSFGDWAEMQTAPALLEIPHPTGYPLFVLLGRAWLLVEPFGSVAARMNLLSAVLVAAAAGLATLVAARLGAAPLVALAGGTLLAVAGTVWSEATVAEVNGFHLLLVTTLLFLTVRWRDERRDRDFLLGGLVAGLAVSNHLLAVGADAVLVPAAVWAGRRRLIERPVLVPAAAALAIVGLAPYLFIPLRVALSGPTEYPALRTLNGILDHVTGVAYRREMHFTSPDSVVAMVRDLPSIGAYVATESSVAVLLLAAVGLVALVRRDRWGALVTFAVFAITLDFFVNYRGDLPHYLLAAWLVLAIWAALGLEVVVRWLRRAIRLPGGRSWAPLALALPIAVGIVNLPAHDLSGDSSGDRFVDEVFGLLPHGAVLYTYWDAGEPLHHARCVDHRRTDLAILAPDDWVSYRPCVAIGPVEALSSGRPLYALAYAGRGLESIAGRYRTEPVTELAVPWGGRAVDHLAELVRIVPLAGG